MRGRWLMLVLAAVVLAGCPKPKPGPHPMPAPSRQPGETPLPGVPPLIPGPFPPGLYFLHDDAFGAGACRYLGELEVPTDATGKNPHSTPDRPEALHWMARQARHAGGNVVVLPHFSEEFGQSSLSGRNYRCSAGQRKAIFERAAALRGLTIIEP